jgi:hypothetical protein
MSYVGLTVLLLIAMTIAANMHPEGPALVILLFWACPALFGGLFMMLDQSGRPANRVWGALLLLLGIWLMALFVRLV